MQLQALQQTTPESHALCVSIACNDTEIREAQQLRYKVFGEEMGARLQGAEAGLDADVYDRWCEHLIVRDHGNSMVVGTYRILGSENARRLGGYYADDEFDLTRLAHLRWRLAEVGRCCVHRDYRGGAVIALLWAGLTQYMERCGYSHVIGCASVSMQDGGAHATAVHLALQECCACPAEYRVYPRLDLPLRQAIPARDVIIPPLINGYVRLGAWVCGAPAWDPDFNTADLLMLLPMAHLGPRYRNRFARITRNSQISHLTRRAHVDKMRFPQVVRL